MARMHGCRIRSCSFHKGILVCCHCVQKLKVQLCRAHMNRRANIGGLPRLAVQTEIAIRQLARLSQTTRTSVRGSCPCAALKPTPRQGLGFRFRFSFPHLWVPLRRYPPCLPTGVSMTRLQSGTTLTGRRPICTQLGTLSSIHLFSPADN